MSVSVLQKTKRATAQAAQSRPGRALNAGTRRGGGGSGPRNPSASLGDAPARRLSQVLAAAHRWLVVTSVDDLNHVACVLFRAGDDEFYSGIVSFDQRTGCMRLEARVGRNDHPSEAQIRSWVLLEAHFTRVCYDSEYGFVSFRATGVCERLDVRSQLILRFLARDMHRALRNSAVQVAPGDGSASDVNGRPTP